MSDALKPDEILSRLTDEQREAARSLKTPEEMLAFAQDQGIELTTEQIEEIAGGKKGNKTKGGADWWPHGGYK